LIRGGTLFTAKKSGQNRLDVVVEISSPLQVLAEREKLHDDPASYSKFTVQLLQSTAYSI
jgi:hypothetical protein